MNADETREEKYLLLGDTDGCAELKKLHVVCAVQSNKQLS